MRLSSLLAVITLFLLLGCGRGALMTANDYADVEVGSPIESVTAKYGEPIEIHHRDNQTIYEYIERINMGTETIEMRKYYFVVKDGVIVRKFTRYSDRPAYDEVYSDDMFPLQGG